LLGYPFNWVTLRGTIKEGTPLITTVPYVYEAFKQVWEMDKADEWFKIMNSTAQHALQDYKDFQTSPGASTCSYTPDPEQSINVVNANASIFGVIPGPLHLSLDHKVQISLGTLRNLSSEKSRAAAIQKKIDKRFAFTTLIDCSGSGV